MRNLWSARNFKVAFLIMEKEHSTENNELNMESWVDFMDFKREMYTGIIFWVNLTKTTLEVL